ncbi:DUF6688 family protein [Myroides odoratimimus]
MNLITRKFITTANLIYILMKPLEWVFLVSLYEIRRKN